MWPATTVSGKSRGFWKFSFFIESRCPPPKLSNDIKYLYSPALDMRIKSKNQRIFLCLSLAKFRENGHVRFCFLTNVSAAMRHCEERITHPYDNANQYLAPPLATTAPSYWFTDTIKAFGFLPRTSACGAKIHLSFPLFVYRLRHSRWRYERRSSAVLQCTVVLPITF